MSGKGSTKNLVDLRDRSPEEAREIRSKGGKRHAEEQRRAKTLREILSRALQEDGGGGMTKEEILVARVLVNSQRNEKMTFKDLKDLQDLLGESVTNMNIRSDQPLIVVRSKEEAEKLKNIGSIEE